MNNYKHLYKKAEQIHESAILNVKYCCDRLRQVELWNSSQSEVLLSVGSTNEHLFVMGSNNSFVISVKNSDPLYYFCGFNVDVEPDAFISQILGHLLYDKTKHETWDADLAREKVIALKRTVKHINDSNFVYSNVFHIIFELEAAMKNPSEFEPLFNKAKEMLGGYSPAIDSSCYQLDENFILNCFLAHFVAVKVRREQSPDDFLSVPYMVAMCSG